MILALLLAAQTVAPLPAAPPPLSPELEREARQIEALVIAPCCWSQQVSVHNSPAATEMRQNIRQRLASGQTRAQILEAFTAEFGDRILAEPPARGFNRMLYVVPPVIGVAGIGLLVVVVRRFTRRGLQPDTSPGPRARAPATASADEDRLDEELRNLD
jgi:cytochrome c-type biogenesis protein CcmH